MAEENIDIQIRTKADTAGMKQAEDAIKGVDTAAKTAGRSIEVMEREAGYLERTLRKLDPASDQFAQTATKLGEVRKEMSQAAAKADEFAGKAGGAAGRARGFGAVATQAGFQVQDFAVQVGSGTSALTAFAQQGSQMLGIFGPGGALAGALLAIGAAAFSAFRAAGDAGEDSTEKAAALAAELVKATEEAAKLNDEFGTASAEAFIAALEREAESFRTVNAEVERNIELLRARRRAQAEVEDEQAALELLRIDQDTTMTEEEKIVARGQVQEGIEGRRMAGRLADIGDRVTAADAAAADARRKVQSTELSRDDAAQRLAQEQAAAEELRARIAAADRVAAAQKQMDSLTATGRDPATGKLQLGRDFYETRARLQQELDAANAASLGPVTDEDRGRLNLLEGPEGESGSIAALSKGLEGLQKALEDARKAADEAATKRDQTAAVAAEEIQGVTGAFMVGRERRGLATSGAAAAAEARRQQEEQQRQREEQQRQQAAGLEGENIADSLVRGAANPAQAAALEGIGNRLAAGGDMSELVAAIERMMGAASEARARELRRALERIERLEAKLKTNGDTGK